MLHRAIYREKETVSVFTSMQSTTNDSDIEKCARGTQSLWWSVTHVTELTGALGGGGGASGPKTREKLAGGEW